jgi:hypothetical protein
MVAVAVRRRDTPEKIADIAEGVPQTICDFWCKKLAGKPSLLGLIVEQ